MQAFLATIGAVAIGIGLIIGAIKTAKYDVRERAVRDGYLTYDGKFYSVKLTHLDGVEPKAHVNHLDC